MGEIKRGKWKNRKHTGREKRLTEEGENVKEISGIGKKQKNKAKYRDAISRKKETVKKNKGIGKRQEWYL